MTLTYRDPVKMAARRERTLDKLAIGDSLFARPARLMIEHECFSVPALDYLTRKRKALRAEYFRQRNGRDYWTGLPSRERISPALAAAFRCGHDDELSGAPSTSAPRIHTTGRALPFYERGRHAALNSLLD